MISSVSGLALPKLSMGHNFIGRLKPAATSKLFWPT